MMAKPKIPPGAVVLKKSDIDAIGKCQDLKPTREDLKHLPGYWEKPAKVMRTGVGLVDGYEWGVSGAPNDGQGKPTKHGEILREAMTPFWKADNERRMNKTGIEPHRLMRCKGTRTMIADASGNLWKRVGNEWIKI